VRSNLKFAVLFTAVDFCAAHSGHPTGIAGLWRAHPVLPSELLIVKSKPPMNEPQLMPLSLSIRRKDRDRAEGGLAVCPD
jgi:hypothetical protein